MAKLRTLALLGGGAAAAYVMRRKLDEIGSKAPPAAKDSIQLFQFDYSPFCAKIRHVLDYKRIPYQAVELTPILHKTMSRGISGQVKVPYLRHHDQVVSDSTAIARYLEETFPERPILPSDSAEREQVLLLEDWLDEAFQPAMGKMAYLYLYLHPQIAIDDPNITTGMPMLDQHKDKLVPIMLGLNVRKSGLTAADLPRVEERLNEVLRRLQGLLKGKDYLVGDKLTLADLTLLGHLSSVRLLPELIANPRWQWLFEWKAKIEQEVGPTAKVTV